MIKVEHYKNFFIKLFKKRKLKENIKILIMFLNLSYSIKNKGFYSFSPVMDIYSLKCFKSNF